jgi:HEAT repeat protein
MYLTDWFFCRYRRRIGLKSSLAAALLAGFVASVSVVNVVEAGMVMRIPIESLVERAGTTDVEVLINKLEDKSNEVRSIVALLLGILGDYRAVEPLITALRDADSHVRAYAVWSLASV